MAWKPIERVRESGLFHSQLEYFRNTISFWNRENKITLNKFQGEKFGGKLLCAKNLSLNFSNGQSTKNLFSIFQTQRVQIGGLQKAIGIWVCYIRIVGRMNSCGIKNLPRKGVQYFKIISQYQDWRNWLKGIFTCKVLGLKLNLVSA